MSARFAFGGLVAMFIAAAVVTALGGGADSATPGVILGRCVVLQGSAWAPSTCNQPGAVAEAVVGDAPTRDQTAGDLGAMGGTQALSMAEVERLWVTYGGDPGQAHIAAAVATAESGRRPGATNASNTNGTVDRGLFQMNSIHGGCSTYDVAENVRCAVKLQRANGWTPWVAYNRGAYRKYLGAT